MKYLIRFIIILLFFLSCKSKIKQENNKITIKKELIETYELLFQPSFDPDLELKFDIYSDSIVKFSLKQNADINVFDSLHKIDYQTYEYISFGDYNKIIPLIKPNFLFDRTLTICEFNKFLTQLRIIDSSCVKHKQGELWFGCDGMPIKYSYTKGKITKEGEFWSPSPKSEQGKAFVTILEILEKDTNQIVVRTVEKIKQYIDGEKWIFKIISKNPLYIKILESPCCPCIK